MVKVWKEKKASIVQNHIPFLLQSSLWSSDKGYKGDYWRSEYSLELSRNLNSLLRSQRAFQVVQVVKNPPANAEDIRPWTAACQASLFFTISRSLLKFMSIELVMSSNHLILCHPLLLLPSIFPSIRVFSSELAFCTRWPEYWSSSFSIRPSNEYSGLIFFRTDWFDLLAIPGTLKSLLQHYNLKA